jgi:hypothetical protein
MKELIKAAEYRFGKPAIVYADGRFVKCPLPIMQAAQTSIRINKLTYFDPDTGKVSKE